MSQMLLPSRSLRFTSAATLVLAGLVLAGCASTAPGGRGASADAAAGGADAGRAGLQESAECRAAQLRPADPMPASALSPEMLQRARSGYVSMRYDVVKGRSDNILVVLSSPPGYYDAIALRHAREYRDPSGATVRGCLMTVNVQF